MFRPMTTFVLAFVGRAHDRSRLPARVREAVRPWIRRRGTTGRRQTTPEPPAEGRILSAPGTAALRAMR